jgi:transposase
MRYELNDYESRVIKPMLPNKQCGVPRVDDRRVLNGIFWGLAIRCAVARSARELRTSYDLLQSLRSLATGWHLGPDHEWLGDGSRCGQ